MTWAAGSLLGGCRGGPVPEPHAAPSIAELAPIPSEKTQLVTVVSEGWGEFRAELRRYARAPGEAWVAVDAPVAVVLGRNGYAWGRGLHGSGAPTGREGPAKREGDGRSPAGVFELGSVYGYDTQWDELSLPYVQATDTLRCVDDPRSRYYNRIVSTEGVEVDWQSAEHMRRDDALYVLTIVVEHNTAATRPGSGSCIFLHLWEGPDKGMSGCTAMSMDELETLASWLRPGASALVALPRAEYDALQSAWELPEGSVSPD
jgi:D-alanyl-D-alanine dipeptidase